MRWSQFALRWGAVLVLSVLPTLVHGAITPSEFLKSPAAVAFTRGQYEEALSGFLALLREHPNDPLLLRYMGLSHHYLGEYAEAIETFRSVLGIAPNAPEIHYFLGISYFAAGEVDSAFEAFETTVSLAADSEYGVRAEEYVAAINRQRADHELNRFVRPWDLYAQFGVEYDTNVRAAPDFQSGEASLRLTQYIDGNYTLLQREGWKIRSGLSTYLSQNLKPGLSDFNLVQFSPVLDASYSTSIKEIPTVLGARYRYTVNFLGNDFMNLFDQTHDPEAYVSLQPSDRLLTTLNYRFRVAQFKNDGDNPTFTSEDGTSNIAGLTQYVYFDKRRHYVYVSYEYEKKDADGRNFDFDRHSVGGGFWISLPMEFGIGANGRYSRIDHFNFEGPDKWEVDRQVYAASIRKNITDNLAISVAYHYYNDDSDISTLNYDRHVAGVYLRYTF